MTPDEATTQLRKLGNTAVIAHRNDILRGVVGSTALGTAVEGTDDRDEMGVFIEPPENVCGLQSIDHYIYRDAGIDENGLSNPSKPGDLDLTFYSLRKYCTLAAKGNPSVLILLFINEHITKTLIGEKLIAMRSAFISKDAGKRYAGFLRAQKQKLMGQRANTTYRPELIAQYGYDTKFAMHALRLGMEGCEVMSTGGLVLPHRGDELQVLKDVRAGNYPYDTVITMIEQYQTTLERLVETTLLREHANEEAINDFLVRAHHEYWWAMP